MASLNKVQVIGNLGADPELKEMANGNVVCRLSVAATRVRKHPQTGEKQKETEWFRISVWGKQAEHCKKYLSKGRQVYVEGRLKTSDYQKPCPKCQHEIKHYSTEVNAEMVQFLGGQFDSAQNTNQSSAPPANAQGNEPDFGDDDIPF